MGEDTPTILGPCMKEKKMKKLTDRVELWYVQHRLNFCYARAAEIPTLEYRLRDLDGWRADKVIQVLGQEIRATERISKEKEKLTKRRIKRLVLLHRTLAHVLQQGKGQELERAQFLKDLVRELILRHSADGVDEENFIEQQSSHLADELVALKVIS